MDSEYFCDDLFLPLDASNTFSGISGVTSSSPTQVDDSNSQCNHGWWDESLGLNSLESNGLQASDLQSDPLQDSYVSQDGYYPKSHASSHSLQAPHQGDFMTIPNTENVRPRGINSWVAFPHRHIMGNTILQDPERSAIYRSSIYGHQEFAPETQHISTFENSFRGDLNLSIQPAPFSNQFSAADLGMLPEYPIADDTASLYSQASCNSKCTSSVCEDENCSVTGIPCDDPTCVENVCPTEMLGLTNQMATQMVSRSVPFHQAHSQPCNHTESEHLVARTLGELRAPAELEAREKTPYTINFDSTLVSRAGEQFYGESRQLPSSPCQLPEKFEKPVSNEPPITWNPTSSLPMPPPEKHICQWTTNPNAPEGERTTCGAQFTNTKDFHDHLCEFHIDKLTSQTGFACLWAGCARKQDRPFVTRGKLRRHISTHSVYKPYTCDICKQGFSGQQALQQHERIHTGLKPFKCTVEGCTMAFKQKSALTMHSRVHTGEKPLQCEFCGKAFPESSNLSKHRKIHLQKSNKYICEEIVKGESCGRAFRRLDQLRRHRQTHLNPGKRRSNHSRSMSAVSTTSGELLDFKQSSATPSGEAQ
ncbi:hypothetical protein F5X98DRAFT_125856 [Xylaria grammica]|nr:hypothetical protein F5X98DRAFT_125856 [Xylaria grammica]